MRNRKYTAAGHTVTLREDDGVLYIGRDGEEEPCDNVREAAVSIGMLVGDFILEDIMAEAVAEGWDYIWGTRKVTAHEQSSTF